MFEALGSRTEMQTIPMCLRSFALKLEKLRGKILANRDSSVKLSPQFLLYCFLVPMALLFNPCEEFDPLLYPGEGG